MSTPLKVAIIGSGISGLAAAHFLHGHADVTLFEAGSYFGGHTHTVGITLPTPKGLITHGVDTGFLVYNERTYPQLIALFAQLGVVTAKSEMSFSVQSAGLLGLGEPALEWSGNSLSSVFAQRSNLWNPQFLTMLWDLLRFNKLATALASELQHSAPSDYASNRFDQPLGEFLQQHRFSQAFKNWYLLPMLGCIWSCPINQMLEFPLATMLRFCHNHGLLQISNRPQWFTVQGGARNYVDKITAQIADKRLNTPVKLVERDTKGVRVITANHAERFDKVILATHAPQALALLNDASGQEQAILGSFHTQANHAVLHTDASVLPTRKSAWAAWNYVRSPQSTMSQGHNTQPQVCLHYLLNKLQPLPFAQPVLVSLNPVAPIATDHILGEFDYAHPVFDAAANRALAKLPALQGVRNTYFCGAWTGYGFHEDGLKSGMSAAHQILAQGQMANRTTAAQNMAPQRMAA